MSNKEIQNTIRQMMIDFDKAKAAGKVVGY
jgi:hypothetical protein